ncbi:hypothetical protein [Novosphingobium panipatense]|uniref:hypothetical protein n=1 Tax=Novosphingobium panipatense TaxID=428991 RepID=UPI00360EC68F
MRLTWTCTDNVLHMEWLERGGPPVQPPERRGFGSTLIEHSMLADGAQIVSDFAPEGVTWTMTLPLGPAVVGGAVKPPRRRSAPGRTVPPLRSHSRTCASWWSRTSHWWQSN